VEVRLKDGRVFHEIEEHNRGSAENPMTYAELRAKFDENAAGFLSKEQRDRLADSIGVLEKLPAAKALVDLAVVPSSWDLIQGRSPNSSEFRDRP
jgi:2-methylcitrate dehydratase PrpD